MTSATEQLRALLDERDVEWKSGDFIQPDVETQWGNNCYTDYPELPPYLAISNCTPEQAIAATLGYETSSVDEALALLDEMNEQGRIEYEDYSQLHDAIATLGRGTCEIETTENWLPAERYHRCKHCGAFFAVMDASGDIPPCVCPNCGKVVER